MRYILDGRDVIIGDMTRGAVTNSELPVRQTPPVESELTEGERLKVESFFRHIYYINPETVATRPIWGPHTYRKSKLKTVKEYNGHFLIEYADNVRARQVFESYTGVNLTGKKSTRVNDYNVAHIFGQANNPMLFTAGFNLALVPNAYVDFTDDQHLDPLLAWAFQSAAYLMFQEIIRKSLSDEEYTKYAFRGIPKVTTQFAPSDSDGHLIKNGRGEPTFVDSEPLGLWFPVNVVKKSNNNKDYIIEALSFR